MAEQLIVPKLGMAAAVATLGKWQVAEGGRVEKGQIVLDIEAEKTAFEMTAPVAGFLHILFPEGVETDVNTVVGLIAATQAEYDALVGGGTAAEPEPQAATQVVEQKATEAPRRDAIASPAARRVAGEHGIDWKTLIGTGPGGRIQKADVEQAVAAKRATPAVAVAAPPAIKAPPIAAPVLDAPSLESNADDNLGKRIKSTLPYKGMRKVIGENMVKSLAVNAPVTFFGDLDLSVFTPYRDKLLKREHELGTRVTYAEMVIYAVAQALKQVPLMNSSLIGSEIRLWDDINVGMAVALGEQGDKGLVVPVIKGAGSMSLAQISKAAKRLAEQARNDKLMPDDMVGGTFTVSNFGSVGPGAYSTPIINVPESAIIGIGRTVKKPIIKNDGIVIAPMLPYSLTHDHRVIDGAVAVRFLGILSDFVERPNFDYWTLV